MKKEITLALSLFLGITMFSSCSDGKDLYDEGGQPTPEKTVADLVIPSDFNWKMTKEVKLVITAEQVSDLSVFLDKECNEGQLIATLETFNGQTTLPLSLPTYVKDIYVQYESADGKKVVTAVSVSEEGTANFALPKNSRQALQTRANGDEGYWTIDYPSASGWGTIMLEDMFPSLGDYDFNDFVLGYKIKFYYDRSAANEEMVFAVNLGVSLRAMGGTLPYTPYLRIKNLKAENVDDIEYPTPGKDIVVGIKESPGKEAVLDFSNLVAAVSKPVGSKYFNTEKDYITALPSSNFVFYLGESVKLKDLSVECFDFYLANKSDGTEIHLRGYEPVFEKVSGFKGYYSDRNLVWGLNVPVQLPHAIEQGNFLDAYSDFEGWATTGGTEKKDWYIENNNRDNSLLIKNVVNP